MSQRPIEFKIVPPSDRGVKNLMLTVFEEPEENRAHLTHFLGEAGANDVLELMAGKHVLGKYKEFNLLRGGEKTNGFDWVLLLGLGQKKDIGRTYRLHDRIRSVAAIAARHFRRKHLSSFAVGDFSEHGVDAETACRLIVEGSILGTYKFSRYKTSKSEKVTEEATIKSVSILSDADAGSVQEIVEQATITATNTCFVRDLVNTPAADLTPGDFASIAEKVAGEVEGLELQVLDVDAMTAEKMGLHLAVGRGSDKPPCVAILKYSPRGEAAGWDMGLVGKGVTFDAGGYSLKTPGGMFRMYGDMAGAAAVLGAARTIAELKIPLNVVSIMPLAENLVSGRAYKPGDILTSRKGLTVEITNTDAEGRLLLADSLSYICDKFKPTYLIDAATLTGSIVTSLGHFVTGLFPHANNLQDEESFANRLLQVGQDTGEWMWRMPVDDDYKVQLASDVADLENCDTDRAAGGGSITAAVFLKQFVDFEVVRAWAHLDIAGTALMERSLIYNKCPYQPKEGGTGIGCRLLTHLAEELSLQHHPASA